MKKFGTLEKIQEQEEKLKKRQERFGLSVLPWYRLKTKKPKRRPNAWSDLDWLLTIPPSPTLWTIKRNKDNKDLEEKPLSFQKKNNKNLTNAWNDLNKSNSDS